MRRAEDKDLYKLPPSGIQTYDDWRQETQEANVEFDPEPDYSDDSDDGVTSSAQRSRQSKTTAAKTLGEPHLHDRLPLDDSNHSHPYAHYKMFSQQSLGKALFFEDDDEEENGKFVDAHIDTAQVTRDTVCEDSAFYSQAKDRHEALAQLENSVNQRTRDNQHDSKPKATNHFKDERNRSIKDKLENFNPVQAERDRMAQQIDAEFTYLSTEDLGDPEEDPYDDGLYPPGRGVPSGDLDGIILPKKLANPCVESRDRKDLHRELLLNQRMGVDVLNRKSDLKKELERRKERQKQREKEEQKKARKTVFEEVLDVQAQKLKKVESDRQKSVDAKHNEPEFLKVHSKIRATKSSNS